MPNSTLVPSSRRLVATLGLAVVLSLGGCGTDGDEAATADSAGADSTNGVPAEGGPTSTDRSVLTTSPSSEGDSAGGAGAESTGAVNPLDGLTIAVDQEIRFAAGGTSATVSGAVIRGERDVYRLGAASGQQLILELASVEANGVVDVFAPDGTSLVSEQASATIALPADGEYLVVVGGTRGNVTYDLTVTIPA